MRYDQTIVFVKALGDKYDPDLGGYTDPEIVKTELRANVTDLGTERSVVLFGEVKQGAKVIRLLNQYLGEWDYIEMNDRRWCLVTMRVLRRKQTIIVQETEAAQIVKG